MIKPPMAPPTFAARGSSVNLVVMLLKSMVDWIAGIVDMVVTC